MCGIAIEMEEPLAPGIWACCIFTPPNLAKRLAEPLTEHEALLAPIFSATFGFEANVNKDD